VTHYLWTCYGDYSFQPEIGLCKNLIRDYVQKLSYVIPRYECRKDEASRRAPLFSSTVEVGGICYTGDTTRTKKQAEIQAARTALLAVQSSTPTDSHLTVPCKKRVTETAPFNVRHSSPENSRMNQNGEDDAAQEQLSLRRSARIRARQNPQCF